MDVGVAQPEDMLQVGRMLDAFNREYDDSTPGPARLTERGL